MIKSDELRMEKRFKKTLCLKKEADFANMTKGEAMAIISDIHDKASKLKGIHNFAEDICRYCENWLKYLGAYNFYGEDRVPGLLVKAAEAEFCKLLDIEPGEKIP